MHKNTFTCLLFIVIFPRKYVVGLTCLIKDNHWYAWIFVFSFRMGPRVCVCVYTVYPSRNGSNGIIMCHVRQSKHMWTGRFLYNEAVPVRIVVFSFCEFHEWQTRTSSTNREHVRVNKVRGIFGSSAPRVKRLPYFHITILVVVHPHPFIQIFNSTESQMRSLKGKNRISHLRKNET